MADGNAWIGVAGAGIGGLIGVSSAFVKHFSDMRQKKLERRWKLEDDEIKRCEAIAVDQQSRRVEIQAQADELFRLCIEALAVRETRAAVTPLANLNVWIANHPLRLRSPVICKAFETYLSDGRIKSIRESSQGGSELQEAQAFIRDQMSQATLFQIALEYWS